MKTALKPVVFLLIAGLFFIGCKKETINNAAGNSDRPSANAGPSQTVQGGSVTLNGTATSYNGPITGYLWSLISGPNLPDIMTPSASATSVENLIPGTYLFQFAVIDSAGLTGVDTTSVIVTAGSIQTLTSQPNNNPWEINFYGNSVLNGTGHAVQLDAAAWTSGGNPVYVHGAFHFDLSSIPAGASILSAKLSLYSAPDPMAGNLTTANSGPDNSFYIRQIASAWTAAGSTWANQPVTTTNNQVAVPHTDQSFLDVIDADVTNLVSAMHSGNNYGFMISLQNETFYNIRQFCSSIHADATKHPKLVVTYQ